VEKLKGKPVTIRDPLESWAIVGVKDDTGSGRLSLDLTRLLFPICQLVTPSYRLEEHTIRERDIWIPNDADDARIEEALNGLDVLIVLEDQAINHRIIRAAKSKSIKVHSLALWEWFPPYDPIKKLFDRIICPNRYCESILKKLGFENTVLLGWPVDVLNLPERRISGPAKMFVHIAGKIETDDRKSTLLTLQAFHRVRNPDVSLTVRSQRPLPWQINDPRIRYFIGNVPNYRDLYREGDVFVQPSKAEGLGLSILEAIACGLPVLTTDYPPMNEYALHRRMLVSTHWGKKPALQTSYIPNAHLKIPRINSLTKRIEWCANHDMTTFSNCNRSWALQCFDPDRLRTEWIQALGS
jgi:glycosyltransferase involved in cell wall biosynthesis